jgi:Na+-transporting methylmalonyl-CoA/oxaloacetate decarboxylase beta subunit
MNCYSLRSYLFAIAKKFEPLLLLPIAFGILLSNLPITGLMAEPVIVDGKVEKIAAPALLLISGC